ncbi:hypothetical protein HY085_02905 [Candidatus Gottesmanbacteria bacterium]|nr:hypothetical protein [Candidatus Gottesmanbacteria bacterium]
MKYFSTVSFLAIIIFGAAIFFRESFTNFFFQDDFFNMTLAQSQNLANAFNIFKRPILDFYFYRPLTTQFFWTVGWQLFGWNQTGYHLITFLFFIINIILVYYLATLLTKSRLTVFLTTFFYAFSSTHFYRLFFLSQFQEIGLATGVFLTVIFYIKKSRWSLLFLALSLMSKETAAVTPVILLACDLFFRKKVGKLFIAHCSLPIFYLLARFMFFGLASGGTYVWDFSPKQVANNFFWYGLWSLGIPEAFVNLKILFVTKLNDLGQFQAFYFVNPEVFTAFGIWGGPIILTFSLFIFTVALFIKIKTLLIHVGKEIFFGAAIFIIFLLPVAFFPFHKFAYSLTVPIFGVSFILANLVVNFPARFLIATLFFYSLLFYFTTQYNLSHHWATGKAFTAEKVFGYLKENSPLVKSYRNIYFQNDDRNYCSLQKPGKDLSSEVAYGIGGQEGLRLLYNNPTLTTYFWDWDKNANLFADSLILDSRLFLRR